MQNHTVPSRSWYCLRSKTFNTGMTSLRHRNIWMWHNLFWVYWVPIGYLAFCIWGRSNPPPPLTFWIWVSIILDIESKSPEQAITRIGRYLRETNDKGIIYTQVERTWGFRGCWFRWWMEQGRSQRRLFPLLSCGLRHQVRGLSYLLEIDVDEQRTRSQQCRGRVYGAINCTTRSHPPYDANGRDK